MASIPVIGEVLEDGRVTVNPVEQQIIVLNGDLAADLDRLADMAADTAHVLRNIVYGGNHRRSSALEAMRMKLVGVMLELYTTAAILRSDGIQEGDNCQSSSRTGRAFAKRVCRKCGKVMSESPDGPTDSYCRC